MSDDRPRDEQEDAEVSKQGGDEVPARKDDLHVVKRRRNAYEKQALIVSILAFVAAAIGTLLSGVQTVYSRQQAELAVENLREAQRLFDAAGPQLNFTSTISTTEDPQRDPSSVITPTDQNPEVDISNNPPTRQNFLNLQIQNVGRESTTITNVEFDVGLPRPWQAVYRPLAPNVFVNGCSTSGLSETGLDPPKPCVLALPYTLAPGTIYTVTTNLRAFYSSLPRCCSGGINMRVSAVGVRGTPVPYRATFRLK